MAKETIETLNDISIDDYVTELHKRKKQILEDFAKAYLAETELKPSEIELVCRDVRTDGIIETIYEFRRKQDGKDEGESNG